MEGSPRLRHEFVGMMFAITIGEVGLQAAALVRAGHPVRLLPAYSHLVLAAIVVASSWVGWTLSVAPGARKDVKRVFQWEFLVLLLDVALVILYFILVRTIDFNKDNVAARIDPASVVAAWIIGIFALFLVWDIITKVAINLRDGSATSLSTWFESDGIRIVPTVVCLIAAFIVWWSVSDSDPAHWIGADFSLLCLVLLFRSLKELASALYPTAAGGGTALRTRIGVPLWWSGGLSIGIVLGILVTRHVIPVPLPAPVLNERLGSVSAPFASPSAARC